MGIDKRSIRGDPVNLNRKLSEIAEVEFSDVVEFAENLEEKLRIYIRDGSYIDVWFSRKIKGRYAYHGERRHLDGTVYRHDNILTKNGYLLKLFQNTSITVPNTMFVIVRSATSLSRRSESF